MVTSRDVAQLAGVSPSAVSLVLSGAGTRHGFAEATQLRVRQAAETLGYSPNHAARSLRRQRTNIITFVTGDLGNRYLAELVAAAEPVAQARGYVVNVVTARTDSVEISLLERMDSGVSDGLVLHRASAAASRQIGQLRRRGVACVLLQGHGAGDIPCVSVDLEQGGLLATRHLIGLGHRRIAHVTDERLDDPRANERLHGFRRAMEEAGLDAGHVVAAENSFGGGAAAVRRVMQAGQRPTAIFMFNDHMAIGALHALDAMGLRVPEDVAIIGFDGTDLGAFSRPALTTVDHPRAEQGRLAITAVLDQIEGVTTGGGRQVLPVGLVVRQSCGARMAG